MPVDRMPWHKEPKIDPKEALSQAIKAARPRACDTSNAAIQAYVRRAFDKEIDKLRSAPSGERNHQLFKSSANLFEFVAAQALTEEEVTSALIDSCRTNGLIADDGEHSVEATIASGRRRGMDQPRDLTHVGKGVANGFHVEDEPAKVVSLSTVFDMERGFWDSRESLRSIYIGALSRMCAPWAVLGYCAARALTTVRPHCTLPALVGGPGTLNWFCAITATSGGGKSSADAVARELVDIPIRTRNLGSGEGVIDAYVRPANKETGEPAGLYESVMFLADEVDTITSLQNRSGNTLMSVLRTGFSGGTLGFSYRQASARHLESHSYRMTLVANIQPAKAGALMDDEKGGTLQRFMWFPGHDPRITVDVPPMPGPLDITSPAEWLYPIASLGIPYEATALIRDDRVRRARNEVDDLNGHSMYIREKFAFALAVLDGRSEMSLEDWQLAGIASRISDHTRDYVRFELDKAQAEASKKRGKQMGISSVAADEEKASHVARKRSSVLNRVLRKLESDGSVPQSKLRPYLGRDYIFLDDVLEQAEREGLIRSVLSENRFGPKGRVWRLNV